MTYELIPVTRTVNGETNETTLIKTTFYSTKGEDISTRICEYLRTIFTNLEQRVEIFQDVEIDFFQFGNKEDNYLLYLKRIENEKESLVNYEELKKILKDFL